MWRRGRGDVAHTLSSTRVLVFVSALSAFCGCCVSFVVVCRVLSFLSSLRRFICCVCFVCAFVFIVLFFFVERVLSLSRVCVHANLPFVVLFVLHVCGRVHRVNLFCQFWAALIQAR